MRITTIGLDIAKIVFQVHGIDGDERVVVRKQLRRSQVIRFFQDLGPCLVGLYEIPTIYFLPFFAKAGGLISYGDDPFEQWRLAAGYIDRILKGAAKPADLPIQAPTKFQLVVNLKTAKALGITMPAKLLATANEVIE
jgi:hypothetical protein